MFAPIDADKAAGVPLLFILVGQFEAPIRIEPSPNCDESFNGEISGSLQNPGNICPILSKLPSQFCFVHLLLFHLKKDLLSNLDLHSRNMIVISFFQLGEQAFEEAALLDPGFAVVRLHI